MLSRLILAGLVSCSFSFAAGHNQIPDIPPDATSTQYQAWKRSFTSVLQFNNDGLNEVVNAGERNLNWLTYMNSFRANDPISFTDRQSGSRGGYPIDKPSEYSPSLILEKFSKVKGDCPVALREIIFGRASFTKDLPVTLEEYVTFARALDRSYQTALRWRMMQPYLEELGARRTEDVRGFYYLSNMADRADKLAAFNELSEAERNQFRGWLLGLCLNDRRRTLETCRARIDSAIVEREDLEALYRSMESAGQRLWNEYFDIPSSAIRDDFTWEVLANGKTRLVTPFRDPVKPEVRDFVLRNNMEEWQLGNWHLDLVFAPNADVRIEFIPGATAHVNGLGGNRIVMDANQPLTEWDAQWTIRHEFGHVLGLPDCYVEFYEEERNVIVNYQLDITNIMCSRAGHIKEINVRELERAYRRVSPTL